MLMVLLPNRSICIPQMLSQNKQTKLWFSTLCKPGQCFLLLHYLFSHWKNTIKQKMQWLLGKCCYPNPFFLLMHSWNSLQRMGKPIKQSILLKWCYVHLFKISAFLKHLKCTEKPRMAWGALLKPHRILDLSHWIH